MHLFSLQRLAQWSPTNIQISTDSSAIEGNWNGEARLLVFPQAYVIKKSNIVLTMRKELLSLKLLIGMTHSISDLLLVSSMAARP